MPPSKTRINCPYCGKEGVPARHPNLCAKNPNERTKGRRGEGRPKANAVQGPPEIVVDARPMDEDKLPDLGNPDAAQPPVGAPPGVAQVPGQPPPNPLKMRPIVDGFCNSFDQMARRGFEEAKKGPPEPPKPVSEKEREDLSETMGAAIIAYGGSASPFLMKWAPLINVSFVCVAIFLPRLFQAKEYLEYKGAAARAQAKRKAAEAGLVPGAGTLQAGESDVDAEHEALGQAVIARVTGQVEA